MIQHHITNDSGIDQMTKVEALCRYVEGSTGRPISREKVEELISKLPSSDLWKVKRDLKETKELYHLGEWLPDDKSTTPILKYPCDPSLEEYTDEEKLLVEEKERKFAAEQESMKKLQKLMQGGGAGGEQCPCPDCSPEGQGGDEE